MSATTTGHGADRLCEAIDRAGSPACVGLDPVLDRLPAGVRTDDAAGSIEAFCMGVLDAVSGIVGVVKPQSACFERFGGAGFSVLERVCAKARDLGLYVILDAKRGDIGVTGEHYAEMAFGAMGADAVTVSPYMGFDTLEPMRRGGRMAFALVRTSNPGSDAVQSVSAGDGTVAETIGRGLATMGRSSVGERGWSDLGAVVAATKPADAASMRELMPEQIFLVPGFGAQGGTVETVRELFTDGAGAVINASRSVLYPAGEGGDWTGRVRAAASAFAEQVAGAARR